MPARKKPVAKHLLDGTYRRDRHAPPSVGTPAAALLPKPADLPPAVAAKWDQLAPLLADTLTPRDGPIFRKLCELLAGQDKLSEVLDVTDMADPRYLRTLRLWASGTDKLLKLSEKFGMTPLDRQNLGVGADAGPPRAKVASRGPTKLDLQGPPK